MSDVTIAPSAVRIRGGTAFIASIPGSHRHPYQIVQLAGRCYPAGGFPASRVKEVGSALRESVIDEHSARRLGEVISLLADYSGAIETVFLRERGAEYLRNRLPTEWPADTVMQVGNEWKVDLTLFTKVMYTYSGGWRAHAYSLTILPNGEIASLSVRDGPVVGDDGSVRGAREREYK